MRVKLTYIPGAIAGASEDEFKNVRSYALDPYNEWLTIRTDTSTITVRVSGLQMWEVKTE